MAFRQLEFKHSGPTLLTATNWNNIQHRRSIAACLVQGVYILEEDRQDHRTLHHALAPPWWNSFNFELLPQVLIDDSDSSIFGAIYKFESPLNTSCKYVVAFRGTLIKWGTVKQDITLNLHYIFSQHKLPNSSRFAKALIAVKTLVDDAGAANVWLAGHSLGSLIALLVGRNMVKMGFLVETYLFNPPFASLSRLVERIIKKQISKFMARIIGDVIRAGILSLGQASQVDNPFIKLASWTPHLFVNPDDLICSHYIPYFEQRKTMVSIGASTIGKMGTQISVTSIITSLSLATEPYHLLPTAYLVTNLAKNLTNKEVHGLAQWWSDSFIGEPELQNL
ncbi:Fungal lipase-like domain containing protein [Heracleum sosnowskyi]|uniref:Fungal lipase-like domain containing protein n=1 Tax=Heracleum sosnowskyi TaxID=360622 RepID=A0AAD8M9J5_9APIA|nr:Fungal lipase-like domain containing protein [Heracleum sosnowskyi]